MKVFPLTDQQYRYAPDEARGMDLRDHFAGLAMQAIISNRGFDIDEVIKKYQADQCVSDAYYIADKMMEAREDA